jgi:hypothetical protein
MHSDKPMIVCTL